MGRDEAREKARQEMRQILKRNRKAFEGRYEAEIKELLGLSRQEIDQITPDGTDLQVYDQLIEVVKQASRQNLSQGELRSRINNLGDVALGIAKRTTGLAGLL